MIQAKFDLGVAIALFNWPALTLAVSNQWGGADSEAKREWFAGAISDMFNERPQTDLEDVETTLLQVMLDEFEVNVDDETAYDVADLIMRLRGATLKGDFTEVDSIHAAWLANKGKNPVRIQKVDGDEEDEDDDSDSGGDEEGDSNEEQEETEM
jgi:pre-rRNA-processing protein TSR2